MSQHSRTKQGRSKRRLHTRRKYRKSHKNYYQSNEMRRSYNTKNTKNKCNKRKMSNARIRTLLKNAEEKVRKFEIRMKGPEGSGMSGSGLIAELNSWKEKVDRYRTLLKCP